MSETENKVMSGNELRLHLYRLLHAGPEGWNNWRKENPDVVLDFRGVKFEGALAANVFDLDFSGANFGRAIFRSANLHGTDFRNSEMWDADLRGANLEGTNFSDATLVRANLGGTKGAILSRANLSGAKLERAEISGDLSNIDISGAECTEAKFLGLNLNKAKANGAYFSKATFNKVSLSEANLMGANFSYAVFEDVDFSNATIGMTIFADNDLSRINGLDSLQHRMPSTIGVDTIYRSAGALPEIFLRGCGVPDEFITYMRSLIAQPIEFYSCFISYSSKDQAFAERLHADLQSKGVRCWFAPEDLKIGDPFRDRIDESIRLHDKLLLILSENSVASPWVSDEVEAAIEREHREGRTVLFPIKIDEAVMESKQAWAAAIRRTRHIGDFTGWKNHESYQKAFGRLLRDLKAKGNPKPPMTTPEAENMAVEHVREFEEIKANIILSTLAPVIATELKRLKTFLHKHAFLLNRSDVGGFYSAWIVPHEIHLEYGASLDLRQAQYDQMKEQLAEIDLHSAPRK